MNNNGHFTFNCTIPPDGVHFVESPPVRGTLGIIWSCFGVILLSTWDTLPSNWVNTIGDPIKRGRWVKFKNHIYDFSEKLLWTTTAVLAPEFMTATMVYDLSRARKVRRLGAQWAAQDHVDWNLAKAYYANMKGFRIEFTDAKSPPVNSSRSSRLGSTEDGQELLSSAEQAQAGKPLSVNGETLVYLRSVGVLDSLPTMTSEELNDKNKTNGLLQMIALVQIIWLVVQVIARHVERLFITQLEIVTLAFAALSILTRAIDWYRPKDVRTYTTVQAVRAIASDESAKIKEVKSDPSFNDSHKDTSAIVGVFVGLLFGGLHCLAWHENFPTPIERTLWRVASLLTMFLPLYMAATRVAWFHRFTSIMWIYWLLVALYTITRLFIIVETGRALFYQPPDTFLSTWTTNLPHLG